MRHCILSDEDLANARRKRKPANRLGYALQLCVLRWPGRLIQPGEAIPEALLDFVAGQLGIGGDDLTAYAERSQTRYEHSASLQREYGYRAFEGQARAEMTRWLEGTADSARSNDGLAEAFLAELRRRQVIVPAPTTVERLCADALVAAERAICERIAGRLGEQDRHRLMTLLREDAPNKVMSLYVWIRKRDPGGTSKAANALMDRLERLEGLNIPAAILDGVPPHRVAALRREGERYYADGLREVPETRRFATLAVCAVEWRAGMLDAIAETHERIVGLTYKEAISKRDELLEDRKAALTETLAGLADVGDALVAAKHDGGDLDEEVARSIG